MSLAVSSAILRAQAASLRRDFPKWHFIISTAGRIWGQKPGPLQPGPGGITYESYEYVEGDDAAQVREQIAAKEGR